VPWSGISWWWNEGTFSPAGGQLFPQLQQGGTVEIVIGDSIRKDFPQAVGELEFARDAVQFELSSKYVSSDRILLSGDIRTKKDARVQQFQRVTCVLAVKNLLEQALKATDPSFNPRSDFVDIAEFAYWEKASMDAWRKKYPKIHLNDTDFTIHRVKGDFLAFLKIKNYQTYILPVDTNALVDLAFSEEMVKKIYPAR
jgi:hypothetical protein